MNVSLTPKLEAFVKDKVDSGLYNNASEVIRESLRATYLAEEGLRDEILKGKREADEGNTTTIDSETEFLEEVRKRRA